jgi:rhamnosyltransferase
VKVTVAVPVLNGAETLDQVLKAVGRQEIDADLELLVADSGSADGSPDIARSRGATVLSVASDEFSHGATRNLLATKARGEAVAFLTQDAVPSGRGWLAELMRGLALAPDVSLSFGPYLPRVDASPRVRRELLDWFASFAPNGEARVDRLGDGERGAPARDLLGPRAFFTDANGCVLKEAWRRVPYRPIAYAEDHQLALDMLRAGYAKVFMPQAQVVHSHEYSLSEQLRRAFDEWRALREVYGYVEPLSVARVRGAVVGETRADARYARSMAMPALPLARATAAAAMHHAARYAGAVLGTRADRLSAGQRRRLSLERRDGFVPASASSAR